MIGVIALFSLSGCGIQKYKVNFDGYGFESRRTSYAAGEKVTVYYGMIATDTDYHFYIDDDVVMKQSYDNDHGYVFTFTMPAHDVTLHEESHNSMMVIPEPEEIELLPSVKFGSSADPEAAEEDPPGADEQEQTWFCPECGRRNTGSVCMECGFEIAERPESKD